MKLSKYIISTLIVSVIFGNCIQSTYANGNLKYKDVEQDHWAYEHIVNMAKEGYLIGDTNSNYNPASYVDKFETARILANISGYKIDNPDAIQKNYSNKAYEKNADILNAYADVFGMWNNTTDRAIAYLIEREILAIEDLSSFIIKENDEESLAPITKGELSVYFVKLLGLEEFSNEISYDFEFADNNEIDEEIRNFTYYMHYAKIMDIDEEGKFNPNAPVSKSVLAMYLDKILNVLIPDMGIVLTETVENSMTAEMYGRLSSDNFDKIETTHAIFDKLVNLGSDDLNAMQFILNGETTRIYKYASDITITLDDYLKTPMELINGMEAIITINNDEIIEIKTSAKEEIETVETEEVLRISVFDVIAAQKETQMVTGVVDEIFVSNNTESYVVLNIYDELLNVNSEKFEFVKNTVNPLALTIGSEVNLFLDEGKIYSATIAQDVDTKFYTGFLLDATENTITIRASGVFEDVFVEFDNITIYNGSQIYDNQEGLDKLEKFMKVSIFIDETDNDKNILINIL